MSTNQISDAEHLADIVGLNSIAVEQTLPIYWILIAVIFISIIVYVIYIRWTKSKHYQLKTLKTQIISDDISYRNAAHQLSQLTIIQSLSIEQENELKQLRFAPNEPSKQTILSFISRV